MSARASQSGRKRVIGYLTRGTLLLAVCSACQESAARTVEARRPAEPVRSSALAVHLERDADSLDAALAALAVAVHETQYVNSSVTTRRLRTSYYRSRTNYKHLEGVVEFYAPALAAALNSRRQEVDDDDAPPPSSFAPGGFPAVEAALWGSAPVRSATLDTVIAGMRKVVQQVRNVGQVLSPTDAQIIELGRLQLARISTLSIAGFDTPLTHRAAVESAEALDGLRALYASVGAERWPRMTRELPELDSTLARASAFLVSNPDFDTFDRLEFLVGYADPAARALDRIRRESGAAPVGMKRGWRADVGSVYDADAFDPRAYAADNAPTPTPALVALGKRLFSDPVLSGTRSRACASCHQPAHAFTNGLARAARVDGHGTIARHTPTLLNAALSPAQFADERAITLEEQVKRVIESPAEMAGSLENSVKRIASDRQYAGLRAAAFPSRSPSGGTDAGDASNVRFAIAAYVRSLVALNSRFDLAVRGDTAQLSTLERLGFNLFMGKAACGTCHFAPMFNGNTPPLYLAADVEVIGVPRHALTPWRIDGDSGRAAVDHLPLHWHAFKTPTVRNAALTAPYMHNGVFRSLEDVLHFYNAGGGAGAGAAVPNQTLSTAQLSLSAREQNAIIAFIGALSDTVPGSGERRLR